MPLPSSNISTASELIWDFQDNSKQENPYKSLVQFGCDVDVENRFKVYNLTNIQTCLYTDFISNEYYILERDFFGQIAKSEDFRSKYLSDYFRKFNELSLFLLSIKPNALTLEITSDESLFYTIGVDNLTIYIERVLLNTEIDAENEIIISIFNGRSNLRNFGGTYKNNLDKLKTFLESIHSANELPN